MGADKIYIEEILDKLITGEISLSEKEELREYIQSTYKDEKLDDLMHVHWEKVDSSLEKNDKASLEEVRSDILSFIEKGQSVDSRIKATENDSWRIYLVRIAAILFIPLLVYSGYLLITLNKQKSLAIEQAVLQEVIASPGSRVHFVLPDSTEVWLNSASKLIFPANLNYQSTRVVKLFGQGYFKVAHDKKHPFIVETADINIKVLGTSFDISSYCDDVGLIATLEEGKIVILNSACKEVARLNPGEQARFNKRTRKLNIEKVDTELTTSWKDGRLIFRNAPLCYVVKRLEKWYNCSISLDSKLYDAHFEYTATIQDETLGEVLKMIEISTSVNTSIKNREVKIWAK